MVVAMLAAVVVAAGNPAPGSFELVATYRGRGGQFASAVAPGPTPGSERLYATYLYWGDTFEVVSLDPATGDARVLPSPVKGEYGARSVAVGADGNLYLGTLPGAHLVKLDTRTQTLVDLGRPSPTEQYVWDLAFGPDGKLYGGTQPSAKLVRYDPATGKLEDLGRMDDEGEYAHYVAASRDGFVYAGIGTKRMGVVAYEIATGKRRQLLPEALRTTGQAAVYQGADGGVYASAGARTFRLEGGAAKPLDGAAPARLAKNRTRDGRPVTLDRGVVTVGAVAGGKPAPRPFAYAGREVPILTLGLGPDGRIYGSTILPARLLRVDEGRGTFDELGELGGGQVYRFLAHGGRALMAAYGCEAPLLSFDPGAPAQPAGPARNPALVHYAGEDLGWRPLALVAGADGAAWVGAQAGYGKLAGALCRWDVATGAVEEHLGVVPDQGITALAAWRSLVVGGTTTIGGGGSKPTQSAARVFLWDPAKKAVTFSVAPVAGAAAVENLVVAPGGLVYGVAGHKLFVVDLEKRAVVLVRELPFPGGTVYGSLSLGPDGRLWGLAGHPRAGVFAIDPATNEVELVGRPPQPITGGGVIRGDGLWFVSGASVYRFTLPPARRGAR